MKKIMIIAGLLCVGFVSAQQKDVFDFERHFQENLIKQKSLLSKNFLHGNFYNAFQTHNGNTVRTLPLDNMPCVVADMSQFNMPNIAATPVYKEAYKERYGHLPLPRIK